jgi:hypothetical protein
MSWNHRVMKRVEFDGDDDWYQIHEVYYNSKQEPGSWTKEGITPGGNTLEELRDELTRMLEATEKEILDYE